MGLLDRIFGRSHDVSTESSEFRELIQKALIHLQTLTDAHDGLWQIGSAAWNADLDAGTITFDSPNGMRAVAPLQIIGTYNTRDSTFLWAWDHPAVSPPLDEHAQQTREYGEAHGISELTQLKLHCSANRCWELTAVACLLCGAQGAYRGPSGPTHVFMTFGDVQLSKAS